jgi:hypothetical protein
MRCPQCGSNNTQKSSALYEQNVRVSDGRSAGLFVTSRGTVGFGGGRRTSRSMSLAAQANAPHRHLPLRSIVAVLVGFSLAVIFADNGGGLLVTICLFVGTFWLSVYLALPTDAEKTEQSRWSSQWYCKKCGHIFFEPGETERSVTSEPLTTHGRSFVSPVLRSTKKNSRQQYIDRVLHPVQRAAGATERDIAGLDAIRNHTAVDGSFDPENVRCDLGIISRLASLGLITYDQRADRFLLRSGQTSEPPERGWWQRTFGE